MVDWVVERLSRRHDRSKFDCGQPLLNAWLVERAGQFERKDLSRTFVAVEEGEAVVLGYYALSTHRVLPGHLPPDEDKRLPRLDVSVVLIGRLAVDRGVQGRGLGEHLLMDAFQRIQRLADEVGIRGVEVDAIDESARQFYLKRGFRSLLDDPNHLFLSLDVIRKLTLP
ncbi:MAG TPA: GNAT family N-acetyltransferase [Pirellulales bacterium]|nr:GNAT family N-acetyltransferase [Pirellulales bacterium]